MQRSFGHTLKFTLSPASPWLSLGPGWAALAGALAAGPVAWDGVWVGRLVGLWLLADPLLGTLWELAVVQGNWRRGDTAGLRLPPGGFALPYTQPASPAGRLALAWRRWRAGTRQEAGDPALAFGLAALLALLLSFWLAPALAGLTLLAIGLTLAAGQGSPDLAAPDGGRVQSLVQLLLPWLMGLFLGAGPSLRSPASLALALCYWCIYLGGLRMLGRHGRAGLLFFGGQAAALGLLLALRLLPAAAALGVLLAAQLLVLSRCRAPAEFLPRVQVYLVVGLLLAALVVGGGA